MRRGWGGEEGISEGVHAAECVVPRGRWRMMCDPSLERWVEPSLAELHRDWMKAEDLSKVQTKEMSYQ